MNVHSGADKQTREGNSVADLLHQGSCRSEGGRGHERATVVVHDYTDGNVHSRHDGLAVDERLCEVTRVAHLGDDVEVGGDTCVGEDDGRQRGESAGSVGVAEELVVGYEGAFLGCCRWSVLDTNGYGQDQDWSVLVTRR